MRKIVLRLGGFGAPVVLSLVLSLVSVPVVIRFAGAGTWAGIAVSQSVVAFAALLVMAGWGVGGPTRVALAPSDERPLIFRDAILIRGTLFLIALVPTAVTCILLTGLPLRVAVAAVLAYLMPALSSAWYYVGEARPVRLLLLETMPQTVGTVAGLLVLALSHDVAGFLLMQFVFALGGVIVAARVVLSGSTLPRLRLSEARSTLRRQWPSVATAATGSLYANGPLIVGALLLPASAMPSVALAYKLFKVATGAIGPYTQILQGWVPSREAGQLRSRSKKALAITVAVALGGGSAFALLGPAAAAMFSSGTIVVSFALTAPFATALAAICLSQVSGLVCLMSLGAGRAVALSTAIGAVVGVPMLLLLAATSGASGLAWAFAAAEWLVALVQLAILQSRSTPRLSTVMQKTVLEPS